MQNVKVEVENSLKDIINQLQESIQLLKGSSIENATVGLNIAIVVIENQIEKNKEEPSLEIQSL